MVLGPSDSDVLIIGAGFAGLSAAVACLKIGIPVRVLEKAPELRMGGSIFIQSNGFRALDALGCGDDLRGMYMQHKRWEFSNSDGSLIAGCNMDECAGGPHEMREVHRLEVVKALAAKLPAGTILFGAEVEKLSYDPSGVPSVRLKGGEWMSARVIVGADGAFSKVATSLGLPPLVPQLFAYRGIATYPADSAPPDSDPPLQIAFGKRGEVCGFVRMNHTQLYWFVSDTNYKMELKLLPMTGEEKKQRALEKLTGWSPRYIRHVQQTEAESIYAGIAHDRIPEVGKRLGRSLVTFAGDAALPTLPNLAVGGNLALEAGMELAATLKEVKEAAGSWEAVSSSDLEAALEKYEAIAVARSRPLLVKARMYSHVNGHPILDYALGRWIRGFMMSIFTTNPRTHFLYVDWKPPVL